MDRQEFSNVMLRLSLRQYVTGKEQMVNSWNLEESIKWSPLRLTDTR
jgi:hypothetical protein